MCTLRCVAVLVGIIWYFILVYFLARFSLVSSMYIRPFLLLSRRGTLKYLSGQVLRTAVCTAAVPALRV